jgi:hypothetical protein
MSTLPKTHSMVIGLQKVVLNLIPISESHNTQLSQHRPYGADPKVHIELVAIAFCISELLFAPISGFPILTLVL